MKFLNVLFFILVFPIVLSAQLAPNINVTDVEGEQYDLYELLDDDKYVFIDFFSYWCGICCNKAPTVKQIYENFGCNTGDVIVLSIDNAGNNSQAIAFEDNCAPGGGSPLISGMQGNGLAAYNAFDLTGQPNFRLISPDGTYLSYNSASMTLSSITSALNNFGISESSCVAGIAPTANFSANAENYTITTTQNSEEATMYSWDFGDGNSSGEVSPTHTYAANGTYDVCLTVNNDFGSDQECTQVTIGVPTAGFESSNNELTANFTNGTVDGETYSWNFGDGNTSEEENPSYTFSAAGTYEVCLTATGASGSDEICENVTVSAMTVGIIDYSTASLFELYPNPTNNLATINMNLKEGNYFLKVYNSAGQITYEQIFNNSISQLNIDFSQYVEGFYFVQLTNESKLIANQKLTVLK